RPLEIWRDRLAIEKRGGMIRKAPGAGHVPADSVMTVVRAGDRGPTLTLIRLEPRTGRRHQLRVQCAERGLPVVRDRTYGDFTRSGAFARTAGTKRLFLHSSETSFEYDFQGQRTSFSAVDPLPGEFEKFL